jgi:hypothetical protein
MNKRFVKLSAAALFAIAALAVQSIALGATTWTVTSYGDDPNDTATLRGALHAARDGDTIDLTGLTGAIVLTNGAAPVLRELPVNASVMIVGPGADKLAIDGNNFSTVFHIFGVTAAISGLTIRNGLATVDADGAGLGGGIRNSGTLTLTDCAVSNNTAAGNGLAGGFGGGIFNLNERTLNITRCTLSGNVAIGGGSDLGEGGAIFNTHGGIDSAGGTVTIDGSAISGNSADLGAGIFNLGTLTISNTVLDGNTATVGAYSGVVANGGFGGAILNLVGSATLTGVTVSNNIAKGEGGNCAGMANGGLVGGTAAVTTASVSASTFTGNAPSPICNSATLNVTNSTIWGNEGSAISSSWGVTNGGTWVPSSVTLVNDTIGANGIGVDNYFGRSSFYLKNTILTHNTDANCRNQTEAGYTITSQDHNISDDTTCAVFLEQPISSVAVDAIPPADCAVSTDQRGVLRPQGTNCDIGAFEATPDFYFSPISAISTTVGASGSANVQVNSFVGFHSAVTLAATSVPTGIATSFGPNPVTPPSYGSTSSTLTVNIGPAVTPATYTVGVKGSSDALVHSTSVKVTVGVTTAGVTQVVGADEAAGCIDNSGVANAVTSKLAQAQADIDAGDTADAKAILNDLLALLQAQRGKHIKTACTINNVTFDPDAVLIADVQALLASL